MKITGDIKKLVLNTAAQVILLEITKAFDKAWKPSNISYPT